MRKHEQLLRGCGREAEESMVAFSKFKKWIFLFFFSNNFVHLAKHFVDD